MAWLLAAALAAGAAEAQEFSRYLSCEGSFTTGEKSAAGHVDLALRYANRTALIQRSNVLPVGERLRYTPSPTNYSMSYRLPAQGTTVIAVPGWLQNTLLVMLPDPLKLNEIRLSVNRQSGVMEGILLNEQQQSLGAFTMQCTSQGEGEVEAPKF